jgi:DNA-binding Xre family transcriptional regulator
MTVGTLASSPDYKPFFGFIKPTLGPGVALGYNSMKRQAKKPKFVAMETREIVAANVQARMDRVFNGATDKPMMLAKRIGTSKSTVQRILNGDVGVTIDILTQLANGLRCEPADLLLPPEGQHQAR